MNPNLYVISGVTGMTGNELARQLLRQNHKVLGFDNFFASSIDTVSDIISNEQFDFFEGDINSSDDMNEMRRRITARNGVFEKLIFINCAAVVHTEYFYRIHDTFTANVLGMKTFLDIAIAEGAAQYINCSTSEVYSMHSFNNSGGGVKESDYILLATAEHSQRTSYAAGKLITEFFMRDAAAKGQIKGCSIRFANVYSKNERFSKHIIPHIIHSLTKNGSVELLENSRINRRTFLHNSDSCGAVLALSAQESALDGSVYNVATDEEISIIDLVRRIAKKLNIPHPNIVFNGTRSADPERRVLCTEKLRRATGWKPLVSLDEGLDGCIACLKEAQK